jgi:hypothetical protein
VRTWLRGGGAETEFKRKKDDHNTRKVGEGARFKIKLPGKKD